MGNRSCLDVVSPDSGRQLFECNNTIANFWIFLLDRATMETCPAGMARNRGKIV